MLLLPAGADSGVRGGGAIWGLFAKCWFRFLNGIIESPLKLKSEIEFSPRLEIF